MNILFHLVRAFLFLLPFQVAVSPASGIDLPFSRIFSLILFLYSLAVGFSRKRYRIPFSHESFFLFSFLVVAALSVIWAENGSWAIRRISFLFSFLPLFPVYSMILREVPDSEPRLLRSLIFGASISAAIGIAEFFSQYVFGVSTLFSFWVGSVLPVFLGSSFAASVAEYPSLLVNIGGATILRASSFFPDPHMAAFYFGLSFPVAAHLFLEEKNARKKTLLAAGSSLILIADLLTFSRGGYLGLVFGISVFIMIGSFRKSSGFRDFFRKSATGILIMTTLLLFMSSVPSVRNRAASSFSFSDGSNVGRMEIYERAVSDILSQPYGFGPGNYPLAVKPAAQYREPIYAHSLSLDIATEYGILGMILFFSAFFSVLAKFLRRGDRGGLFLAFSLCIFFGHSVVETPLYSVHVLPALLLFFALPENRECE